MGTKPTVDPHKVLRWDEAGHTLRIKVIWTYQFWQDQPANSCVWGGKGDQKCLISTCPLLCSHETLGNSQWWIIMCLSGGHLNSHWMFPSCQAALILVRRVQCPLSAHLTFIAILVPDCDRSKWYIGIQLALKRALNKQWVANRH